MILLTFTWLSLVVSLMASFCVVLFFLRDVLDEIWDLIGSVLTGFLPTLVNMLTDQLSLNRGSKLCVNSRTFSSLSHIFVCIVFLQTFLLFMSHKAYECGVYITLLTSLICLTFH